MTLTIGSIYRRPEETLSQVTLNNRIPKIGPAPPSVCLSQHHCFWIYRNLLQAVGDILRHGLLKACIKVLRQKPLHRGGPWPDY